MVQFPLNPDGSLGKPDGALGPAAAGQELTSAGDGVLAGGELSPWIAVANDGGQQQVALWQVQDSEQQAVALFSTQSKADQYAEAVRIEQPQVVQLDQIALVRLLVDAHQSGHKYAALDPTGESVRSVFKVADVLRAARETLKSK